MNEKLVKTMKFCESRLPLKVDFNVNFQTSFKQVCQSDVLAWNLIDLGNNIVLWDIVA